MCMQLPPDFGRAQFQCFAESAIEATSSVNICTLRVTCAESRVWVWTHFHIQQWVMCPSWPLYQSGKSLDKHFCPVVKLPCYISITKTRKYCCLCSCVPWPLSHLPWQVIQSFGCLENLKIAGGEVHWENSPDGVWWLSKLFTHGKDFIIRVDIE